MGDVCAKSRALDFSDFCCWSDFQPSGWISIQLALFQRSGWISIQLPWLDFHPCCVIYITKRKSRQLVLELQRSNDSGECSKEFFFRSHPISAPCFQTIGKPPPRSWAPFHYWQQKSGSSSETLLPPGESTYWPSNEDCLSLCCRTWS